MSFERKQIVREMFRSIETFYGQNSGLVIEGIFESFTAPRVLTNICVCGYRSEDEAQDGMRLHFSLAADRFGNGLVSWSDFLDYFVGISMAIEEDEMFEFITRNCWKRTDGRIFGAKNRRVAVEHLDGREEVVELEDGDDNQTFDSTTVKKTLRANGIDDIAGVRL
jgi:hypothetical protein